MTLVSDMIGQPRRLPHSSSMNTDLNEKEQHRKHERLNLSIRNLFPRHRQSNDLERKTTNERNSFLQPSLTITTSELSRSISNKSITFASVFDESENENINRVTFNLDSSAENVDLVVVVPNKYVINEPIVHQSSTNTEPYPFRSEIPLSSNLSSDVVRSSHRRKKFYQYLLQPHRTKKVRRPIQIKPASRSESAPNNLLSLTSIPTSMTRTTNADDDQHRSLKTVRRWLKSSSFGRLFQSIVKHPNRNLTKQNTSLKSTTFRKYSDLIY